MYKLCGVNCQFIGLITCLWLEMLQGLLIVKSINKIVLLFICRLISKKAVGFQLKFRQACHAKNSRTVLYYVKIITICAINRYLICIWLLSLLSYFQPNFSILEDCYILVIFTCWRRLLVFFYEWYWIESISVGWSSLHEEHLWNQAVASRSASVTETFSLGTK